jgi:hypothetical protein
MSILGSKRPNFPSSPAGLDYPPFFQLVTTHYAHFLYLPWESPIMNLRPSTNAAIPTAQCAHIDSGPETPAPRGQIAPPGHPSGFTVNH